MKRLSKAVSFAMVILIIFTLISTTNINTYACLNLSFNNRNVVNAAVIFFRMDDPFTKVKLLLIYGIVIRWIWIKTVIICYNMFC